MVRWVGLESTLQSSIVLLFVPNDFYTNETNLLRSATKYGKKKRVSTVSQAQLQTCNKIHLLACTDYRNISVTHAQAQFFFQLDIFNKYLADLDTIPVHFWCMRRVWDRFTRIYLLLLIMILYQKKKKEGGFGGMILSVRKNSIIKRNFW